MYALLWYINQFKWTCIKFVCKYLHIEVIYRITGSRTVFLTKNWAIKIPNFSHQQSNGLKGMFSNRYEYRVYTSFLKEGHLDAIEYMCPTPYGLPFGILSIQKRVKPLDRDLTVEEERRLHQIKDYYKDSSHFGLLDNKLVCIDFGHRY